MEAETEALSDKFDSSSSPSCNFHDTAGPGQGLGLTSEEDDSTCDNDSECELMPWLFGERSETDTCEVGEEAECSVNSCRCRCRCGLCSSSSVESLSADALGNGDDSVKDNVL
jgi:hypothetical protein